jgi:hypothetical protein
MILVVVRFESIEPLQTFKQVHKPRPQWWGFLCPLLAVTSRSPAKLLRGCCFVLPWFGGHLKMYAIMRKEVSYDEEEAI